MSILETPYTLGYNLITGEENQLCKNGLVKVLPKIDITEIIDLYNMLEEITIPKFPKGHRRNFPEHRCVCWGYTKKRFTNVVGLSSASLRYPEIYEELLRIGKLICPPDFKFTSIHMNHNLTCVPHVDDKNASSTVLLSLGDYTGSYIVVENEIYDSNQQPIMFDGSKLMHWNTPDLVGNKYSLVFYCVQGA